MIESDIDKNNDNNKSDSSENKEKKSRNRLSKREKHKERRDLLLNELENKMGLSEDKRGVLLYDLENNEELKNYLLDNLNEIKETHKCGCWNYFIKKEEKRDEIGLLKSIFKDNKYELITKQKYETRDDIKKKYSCVYFLKDKEINKILK